MKILLGVPEYPPHFIGGGGVVYQNLAEKYRELGHEVVVIFGYYPTRSWSEDVKKYTDTSGIKFYQIPEIPFPKSKPFLRTTMPPNFKAWRQLKKIIQEENPDVAHLHGYGLVFVNILAGILRKLGIKYVFTIHGYPETQNKSHFLVRLAWKAYIKLVMDRTLKNAERITCVSGSIKNDRRNIFPKKSVAIHNGINLADFREVKDEIDVRKKHAIPDGAKIIFSIGRIAEMKGFQEIIKLLPQFSKRGSEARYLIAGADEGYKKELERLARESGMEKDVEFLGFLDLETKKQYLKACDVFAVPSLWEPFGLVALEAMVYNKIIVSSEKDGLWEVLAGYPNKISLSNPELIEKIIVTKPIVPDQGVLERFDYGLIAEKYLKILNQYVK